ncbi:hypothetical protein LAD67_17760 [Escherichia coli]|nr:hypothetical protein [Escherichia coli]
MLTRKFRVKRKSSEAGRKSAFAHKVKNGGKNYQRNVQERINRKGASKEVVVKNLQEVRLPGREFETVY